MKKAMKIYGYIMLLGVYQLFGRSGKTLNCTLRIIRLRNSGKSICQQLSILNVSWPTSIMQNWPEGTGSGTYPVPATEHDKSMSVAGLKWLVALRNKGFWTGSYGDRRRDLLNWLIKQTD